ncbi:MAG: hypothetical protein UU20_C0039G0002 [Parcubacteria group bacterium GW2011_GWE2_40_8]|nr:MAG: hypothetical protein UU20_C0039G0002 [Parcubacteria group bacterium GW2011_GWE2_40_8]
MAKGEVIIRFDVVSFDYGHNKPILNEADFTVRRGAKVTLMGQNGAGKSTIFGLITGAHKPEEGNIHISQKASMAIARQVIPRDQMELTVREFFEKCFAEKVYDIDPRIDKALEAVNLDAPKDRIIKSFSGGQQARLLLASALIQNPDILLLDEPTNNLDKEGIAHLTKFLIEYKKTVIVISHDAEFLNAFTHGVLYLDIHTRKVEQYDGNYNDVVKDIVARIERENRKNAQFAKEIQAKKEKANFFAKKGGQMRMVAKRMREKAEEMEEAKVDVRKEDKTIRSFAILSQADIAGEILNISSVSVIKNHKPVDKKVKISLKKGQHLLLEGPNGIGKSTLLEAIATGKAKGVEIAESVRVGYYRQNFSTLNFEDTVHDALASVMAKQDEEALRATASGFLIGQDIIYTKTGLLILDEPTNHINFRHIPIIAAALNRYDGAMILVSHVPEFVKQIKIDETLDMGS